MNGMIIPRPEHGGGDPDGMNPARTARGLSALASYAEVTGDEESSFRDLISDLLHAGQARGLDLADELRIAIQNFNGETAS